MTEKNISAHKHEPLFHIVKRDSLPLGKAILVRVIAIFAALVFCAIISALLIGANPIKLYTTMFDGAFGTPRRMWKFAKDLALLLGFALAVTPAFKMKFWNLGANGQILIGGLAAIACSYYLGGKVPESVLIIIEVLASVLFGALWAAIPAICKVLWDTNETLFTLMLTITLSLFLYKKSRVILLYYITKRCKWLPL